MTCTTVSSVTTVTNSGRKLLQTNNVPLRITATTTSNDNSLTINNFNNARDNNFLASQLLSVTGLTLIPGTFAINGVCFFLPLITPMRLYWWPVYDPLSVSPCNWSFCVLLIFHPHG